MRFKITQGRHFHYQSKSVYDSLLLDNTYIVSELAYGGVLVKFSLSTGGASVKMHSFEVNSYCEIWPQKLDIVLW